MLTPMQIHALISLAARWDKRKASEEEVETWTLTARRGRWRSFDEAAEVIIDFYTRPGEKIGERRWINPWDISTWFRQNAQQPPPYVPELEGPQPANAEVRAKMIREWAEQVARKKAIPAEN